MSKIKIKNISLFLLWILSGYITFEDGKISEPQSVCIKCHLETEEKELIAPVEDFTKKENDRYVDVHARVGLSCHHCHGGDPTNEDKAKDKSKGYIGKPKIQDIPLLCSKCHSDIEYMKQFNPRLPTDQYQAYLTSMHGKKLKAGDTKVATCVSCHNSHGIRSVKDPRSAVFPTNIPGLCAKCHSDENYMKEYGIPTNQLTEYAQSKHGKMLLEHADLTAANCATCHGDHGATPPGVAAVHEVCGQCHTQQEEYFLKSDHVKVFKEKKLPGCVTCHGKHYIPTPTSEMMNNKPGSVCMMCHQVNDHCYIAVENMKNAMDTIEVKLQEANQILTKAERLGMGVEKAKFSLNEVKDYLVKAKIKVHEFEEKSVLEELSKAEQIIESAIKKGKEALQEWQFRRVGLGVSLVLIILTIIALILKIRTLEQ